MPKTPYENQWKFVLGEHKRQVKKWAVANKKKREEEAAKAKGQNGE